MDSKEMRVFRASHLVRLTRDALHNVQEKELVNYGTTLGESAVLWVIYSIGKEATPSKIARQVYRKPNTIAATLARMQKKGMIKLYKDKKVKNLVRIKLTKKGKDVYNNTLKRVSLINIFKEFSDDDFDKLESLLNRIIDSAWQQLGNDIYKPT